VKPATSIAKVCRVLDAFRDRPVLGVMEVANKTGLLPSDVHRILGSLETFDYIERNPETRKYALGLELLRQGHRVLQRLEVRDIGRPFLLRLAERTEATANLAIFAAREEEIIFIEQIDSPAEVQIKLRVGAHASPHATAVGKVFCAYMPREEARLVLQNGGMSKKTPRTITNLAKLEREFQSIRDKGYAVDLEEAMEGACCLGAPVRNHAGEVIAAVSVSMMAQSFNRWHEPKLAGLVKSAAGGFSAALGYRVPEGRKAHAI
jgi:IclR family acetate operon transcriptional repressor